MALKGQKKLDYMAAYRERQKNAKAIEKANQPAQKAVGPKPTLPFSDQNNFRLKPADLKSVTDAFNVDDPAIADHIADIVYKHTFNYQGAAAELAKGKSPADIATLAYYWRGHPSIQSAVQRMLNRIGLDDNAKKRFVAALWNDYYNGNSRDKSNAAKILATAFGFGSKTANENNRPVELPIQDLSKGLDDMGLGDEVMNEHPSAEFNAENLAIINSEEEDEEN